MIRYLDKINFNRYRYQPGGHDRLGVLRDRRTFASPSLLTYALALNRCISQPYPTQLSDARVQDDASLAALTSTTHSCTWPGGAGAHSGVTKLPSPRDRLSLSAGASRRKRKSGASHVTNRRWPRTSRHLASSYL